MVWALCEGKSPVDWYPDYWTAQIKDVGYQGNYPSTLKEPPPKGGVTYQFFITGSNPYGFTINRNTGEIKWDYKKVLAALGDPPQYIIGYLNVEVVDSNNFTTEVMLFFYAQRLAPLTAPTSYFMLDINESYTNPTTKVTTLYKGSYSSAPKDGATGGSQSYTYKLGYGAPPSAFIDGGTAQVTWDWKRDVDNIDGPMPKVINTACALIVKSSDGQTVTTPSDFIKFKIMCFYALTWDGGQKYKTPDIVGRKHTLKGVPQGLPAYLPSGGIKPYVYGLIQDNDSDDDRMIGLIIDQDTAKIELRSKSSGTDYTDPDTFAGMSGTIQVTVLDSANEQVVSETYNWKCVKN